MWKSTMKNTTKLTVELHDLVENGVDIWDFDYPSYYEGEEKKAFEQKVIDHYYFRQIGQETIGRFKHYFKMRMREIMPKYVQMYKSVEMMSGIDDIFGNVDIVETYEETATSSGSSSATGSSSSSSSGSSSSSTSGSESSEKTDNKNTEDNSEHRFSNTPQGSISNLDDYMTEASKDKKDIFESVSSEGSSSSHISSEGESSSSSEDESSSSSESSGTTTVTHTLTKKGNQGVNTYAHDIIEFRQTIIDVDMMIIKDLNCLFLGVY